MKKSLLALAVLAGISMLFMGCPKGTDTPAEPTSDPATNVEKPAEETPAGPTVVKTIELKKFVKWSELGITADNAGEYLIKATYKLTDASKKGWGPVGVCDSEYNGVASLGGLFNVNENGVNEVEVSVIIAELKDGVLFNFWGDSYASDYKIELIKK